MKAVETDAKLVAYCGLYCGACKRYLQDKCPGCFQNIKASWCKVRSCCMENGHLSCADCKVFSDPNECKKFNNIVSKIFGIILKSDRAACIDQIKAMGVEGYAGKMASTRRRTLKR